MCWKDSSCFKLELSPFKKQIWNGTRKDIGINFKKLLVKAFGAARVDRSTTKDKLETSPFKPGGAASAALGNMVHRVVKTGRDDTGCGPWLYITFNGKKNKQITVINAYIVCLQRDPRDTTVSKQQQCIQCADDELMPYVLDPHKQTLID
jgi:hypothetical protein